MINTATSHIGFRRVVREKRYSFNPERKSHPSLHQGLTKTQRQRNQFQASAQDDNYFIRLPPLSDRTLRARPVPTRER